MNKLPTKQIYLLILIISGIVALSVYSTFAIFTYESETSNIVSIHTPNTLNLLEETYEYKQINIPKNSYVTTDIDIYNNFDNNLCYNIWYKPVGNISEENIQVFQNKSDTLTTNSTIESSTNRRINIIAINDNDYDVKLNIGLSYSQNGDICELNISKDKKVITNTLTDAKELSSTIISNNKTEINDAGYLTYKDNNDEIILSTDRKYYISDKFTFRNEIFTLTDAKYLSPEEIREYTNNNENDFYTCLEDSECRFVYHVTEIKEEVIDKVNDIEIKEYTITKYDTLVAYLPGESGLRKVENNYLYFGDNPNNFIYFNCTNELDTKTCELWRIMGIMYDANNDEYYTKIIKDSSIGTYAFSNNDQKWNNSNIEEYLTNDYKLVNTNLLREITFTQQNITDIDIIPNTIENIFNNYKSNINIMNVTDYLNASICQNKKISEFDENCLSNNWLNKNFDTNEWTMSVKNEKSTIDEETKKTITPANNTIYTVGNNIEDVIMTTKLNVRPIVYLKSRTLLVSGNGTIEEPYQIK